MLYIKHVTERLCGQLHNAPCFQIALNVIKKKKKKKKKNSVASYNLTYNSSVDVLFIHKEIISICHKLKTSGQYSVFYAKVALMQIAALLLSVLNIYN